MQFDKFDDNKKRLIEGLRKYRGIITSACEYANLDRQTFYNYKNDDPLFAEEVESVSEEQIDFVEGKLYEKINGISVMDKSSVYTQPPDTTAIIFYLKTKGKKRGYVERSEVDHTTKGESINPTPITFSKKNG